MRKTEVSKTRDENLDTFSNFNYNIIQMICTKTEGLRHEGMAQAGFTTT